MNRRLYAIHRWLSAIALVQLAIWVASGLFFAVIPDKQLKGAPVAAAHAAPISPTDELVPPSTIVAKLGRVDKIELVGTPEGPFYRAKVGDRRHRYDARSGEERPVSETEAQRVASRDQPGDRRALTTTLIERDPHIEYRGKPLPAWRVVLDDGAGTAIYVDAVTGEVTARRNDVWRIYDFLWGLHLMDYGQRDTRNHPLLAASAILGLLTVVSGAVLWIVRAVRWLRRGSARK
ncbi:MAG: PepSY domain-containing protein [Labilithrix sp.]